MEELAKYLNSLSENLGPSVKNAVMGQIDEEARRTFDQIKQTTPDSRANPNSKVPFVSTHLVDTLTIKPVSKFGYYGYVIDYEGYNEKGVAYSLIARSLNKGSAKGNVATHHIDNAVNQLTGMDKRIDAAVQRALNDLKL